MRRSQYRLTDATGRVKYSFIATFNDSHACTGVDSLLTDEVPEHVLFGAIEGDGQPVQDGGEALTVTETMIEGLNPITNPSY